MTNSICCRPIIERCQSDVKRLYASRVTIVRLLTDSSETDRWPSLHLLLLSLHIMPICNQLIDDRWDKISLFKDSCNSITDTVYTFKPSVVIRRKNPAESDKTTTDTQKNLLLPSVGFGKILCKSRRGTKTEILSQDHGLIMLR